MRPVCLLIVLAALLAGCGGGDEVDPKAAGRIEVREQAVAPEDGRRYIEGAVQVVEARRVGEDEPAFSKRIDEKNLVDGLVAPGDYVLTSFTRGCRGTCGRLGPPEDRCEQRVRVGRRERVAFAVTTTNGVRCVLRREAPRRSGRPPFIDDARVLAHRLLDDRRRVQVLYGHSGSERLLRVDVRETGHAVAVRVLTQRPKAGQDLSKVLSCTTIRLGDELGGRVLRSRQTGLRLPTLGEYAARDPIPETAERACDAKTAKALAVQRDVPTPLLGRVASDGLPVEQGALPGDLCPSQAELEDADARRDRAAARRQLRALERVYLSRPNAVVRTSYLPSGGGIAYEELLLVDLVATHLRAIPEVMRTGDASSRACAKRLDARLAELR